MLVGFLLMPCKQLFLNHREFPHLMTLNPPLLPYELDILLWINGHHSPILDAFMYMISNPPAWMPVVVVLLYYLFDRKPWQEALLLLLCVGLCVLCCDQLSSGFAKPYFSRPRPTHTEDIAEQIHVVYGYWGRMYGFFSGHASNFTAVGVLLCRVVRRSSFSWLVALLVSVVIYSRMYLGVHYLSDILAGVGVGLFVGWSMSLLYGRLRNHLSPLGRVTSQQVYAQGIGYVIFTLCCYLPLLLIYSYQVGKIVLRVLD